jgi:HSP20 family protein
MLKKISSNFSLDKKTLIFYYCDVVSSDLFIERTKTMKTPPFRGQATLQDQINRLFNDAFERTEQESNLTSWAPAVDIYENEHELVVKADLPGVELKDLDIRVENNILTIRGERRFEKKVSEDNYLRVERAYGSFSRSFALANSVNPDGIKADYQNGVLTLNVPKREEAKPKQIKVTVGSSTGTPAFAAAGAA